MKVALLFLTYDTPLHTSQWMDYIENRNFDIIIHPKYPKKITNEWKPFLSTKIVETNWGADTIIIATLILLKQALESSNNNDWFILCSGDSYPLLNSNDCLDYFNDKELSIFHPIDENNSSKMSQWFAMSREDVSSIIDNLRIDSNYDIRNNQLYNSIIKNIPRGSAVDELFFVPLLKKINANYQYEVGLIHYVKWIPNWVSKHPTIFNRLLPSDSISIQNNNPLFIRKTFSTFKNQTIIPKPNAVIITIGSENVGKINYDDFLDMIEDTHDLYLLLMIDSMNEISEKLKSQCIQSYSVVWNMVEKAHKNVATLEKIKNDKFMTPHYNEVVILKENDNPYDYIRPQSPNTSSLQQVRPTSPDMPPPPAKFRPTSPDMPPPPAKFRPTSPDMPPPPPEKFRPTSPDMPPPPAKFRPVTPDMPPPPSSSSLQISRGGNSSISHNPNYKIAYLFLLREDLNHPEIWTNYFIPESVQHVSRYVHSKFGERIKTSWVRNSLIEDIKETGWGYIVGAYFSLFREAIKDPDNLKFVLISESCAPVKNYNQFKNFLDNSDYRNSYVHFLRSSSYDKKERIQNQPNYQKFGEFTKHYARMCLSRYHVEKLLSQTQNDINFFVNMHVGDEFFMTLLNAKPNQDYIMDKTITYDNWDYVNNEVKKLKNKMYELKDELKISPNVSLENEINELENKINDIQKNPKTYYDITPEDIEEVFRSGAFFWRKFPASLSLEEYYDEYGALKRIKKRGGSKKRRNNKSKSKTKTKTKKNCKKI